MKRLIGNASLYLCAWLDAIPAVAHDEDGHLRWYRHGDWGCLMHVSRPWAYWGDA